MPDTTSATPDINPSATPGETLDKEDATQMTCDVLCALAATAPQNMMAPDDSFTSDDPSCDDSAGGKKRKQSKECPKTCPKQLQLPMFLSKTYHMIDRCDPDIAAWSESGDNFVVKHVDKFASHVLPKYFKHSNFASFARQLNFYGFRKLRSDPILTCEVDPQTACYVRFYHEKFQKDQPDLLHQIKRATKTDQQSKDEVENLKMEVAKLREALALATSEYDRKLAELSYDCNRRISAMTTEYDKLALLVQQSISAAAAAPGVQQSIGDSTSAPGAIATADLLHSLSQAAMSLQTHLRPNNGNAPLASLVAAGTKRSEFEGCNDTDESNKRKKPAGTNGDK